AIAYINARPRPLALNCFDSDRARIRKVLDQTHSGGVCVNDTVMHVAVDDLPFGGSGESGMGRYHGRQGFETFSNVRGVFWRPRWLNTARVLYPPYGGRLIRFLHKFTLKN
ncbi:MAG: aldehyde dehydrogenase family protein, partial [Gammaproteobacteria bacterium]|nr:aldehyde dehydrogenase family protein [Gammaproteobacteria bacterium]